MCLLPRASTGVTSGGAKRYHELKTKAKVPKGGQPAVVLSFPLNTVSIRNNY
jgi:hypothetical protein